MHDLTPPIGRITPAVTVSQSLAITYFTPEKLASFIDGCSSLWAISPSKKKLASSYKYYKSDARPSGLKKSR